MCGIAGFFDPHRRTPDAQAVAMAMSDTLMHRGPDAGNVWLNAHAGIALGHRRLSILDLSEAGSQPMVSSNGRFVLTYNGEVYNAPELRRDLLKLGCTLKGHSDTEVIVEGFANWGVFKTLERMIGMFAFGVWDNKERQLILVRDRLGIKPLYWGKFDSVLIFASELSALKRHPAFGNSINRNALVSYLRHNYVPGPLSIFENVQKLEPGMTLTVTQSLEPQLKPFWSLKSVVESGRSNQLQLSDEDAVNSVADLLGDAVEKRMLSDVPLGAFLSGGIDSSTIAALMQSRSERPVRTFSIGFHESGFNEAHHAAAVARHLGTDHTELYVDHAQARDVIPSLPAIYDEPFADSSQIPTYLVSEMTRKHVTVVLSGDGGDELFGGYNRYFQLPAIRNRIAFLPASLRRGLANLLRLIPPERWSSMLKPMPALGRIPMIGDKIHKVANILPEDADGAFRRLVSEWDRPSELVIDGQEIVHPIWKDAKDSVSEFVERMQYIDLATYFPDDILTKVDRASMAVSLEARVPFSDHRVVEYAWRLPQHLKIRNGTGKWILRQVLYQHVPRQLMDRPKMGFGIPLDQWLRGPLRDWAEDLLSERRMVQDGYLNPMPIRQRWQEHLSGNRNWQYSLWGVLMFNAWLDQHRTP